MSLCSGVSPYHSRTSGRHIRSTILLVFAAPSVWLHSYKGCYTILIPWRRTFIFRSASAACVVQYTLHFSDSNIYGLGSYKDILPSFVLVQPSDYCWKVQTRWNPNCLWQSYINYCNFVPQIFRWLSYMRRAASNKYLRFDAIRWKN